jgi:hypothetical protein
MIPPDGFSVWLCSRLLKGSNGESNDDKFGAEEMPCIFKMQGICPLPRHAIQKSGFWKKPDF